MNHPLKISIITTNFNGALFLERTIQSVLSQGYHNLEYIIIDGLSTDDSVQIIKKYEKSITYWTSEKDDGMYHALQKGFARSTGDIMAWLNSDDLYHPGAFYRIADLFINFPTIKWVTGVPMAIDESDNFMVPFYHDYPVWSKLRFYSFDYKWIQQESTFWRRELWQKSGNSLNTSLRYAGDFDLWLRFFRHEKLYSAPILVGGFRMRKYGQQSIVHRDKYVKEVSNVLKKELGLGIFFSILSIPINLIDRMLISLPGVKGIYHKSGIRRILNYPGKLEFNPQLQKFELK